MLLNPQIALDRGPFVWIREGANYLLEGTVSKPDVTARIAVNDVPVDADNSIRGTRLSALLTLDCDATSRIRIDTLDLAGNANSVEQTVKCDTQAPTIGHLPSPFTQEKSGAVVELDYKVHTDANNIQLQEASDTVLEKQWNRLDDRVDHAPPTLNFAIGDLGASGTGTPNEALKVSYKYVYRGSGVRREREWTPLACTRQGVCRVVMSYQTMLPTEVRIQPVKIARKQNFIAHSSPSDLHSFVIKVEDLAGNVTVAEWSVHLQLFSQEVDVSCGPHPSLMDARLKSKAKATIAEVSGPAFPVFNIALTTKFSLDDDESLTPTEASHLFALPESKLEWRIDRIMQQRAAISIPMLHTSGSCGHRRHDRDIFIEFDGGDCEYPSRRARFPHQFIWGREEAHHGLVSSQRIYPRLGTVELRDGSENINHALLTTGQPQNPDGHYPITAARNVQADDETQWSYRTGWEYERGGLKSIKIDERKFIRDLRIIRVESYKPVLSGSGSNTPPPLRINYAASCEAAVTMSWRDERAPSVHNGDVPHINDLGAYYGAQP